MRVFLPRFLALCVAGSSFAQGPLSPLAGPAPTGRSLDQVEPRTPIPGGSTSTPFIITQPGSYALTGNITFNASGTSVDAIQVQTDNVSIDLRGFAITSVSGNAAGSGVLINGTRKNVTVCNGSIVGGTTLSGTTFTSTGFFNGIFASGGSRNLRFENLSISNVRRGICDNGVPGGDASSVARGCSVNISANDGIIVATAENCTVTDAGGNGIFAVTVLNCVSRTLGSLAGQGAINAEVVQNSRGINAVGVSTGIRSTNATNSIGRSDTGPGLTATTASYCRGDSATGTGLSANIAIGCTGSSISATNKYLMP